ncbi:MAG: rSAM/selenodomain-associated transferase 2 [Gammaproteobacteria bacterium]|jgi:rSAM/selenodomain-associated transferase 2
MGRISVIIPVRNEAILIASVLLALDGWRQLGHEIIVVDGESSDNTLAIAKPLCDQLVQTSAGRARQMNAGAKIACGDVFLFLHADTKLPKELESEIAALSERGDAFWGRCDVLLDGKESIYRVVEWLMNWRSRLTGIATGDQAMFVSRDLFDQCGGFPNIALMEDIALSTSLRQIVTPKCLSLRVRTSARRWQRNGVIRTILTMWGLRAAFFVGVSPQRLNTIYQRGSADDR